MINIYFKQGLKMKLYASFSDSVYTENISILFVIGDYIRFILSKST